MIAIVSTMVMCLGMFGMMYIKANLGNIKYHWKIYVTSLYFILSRYIRNIIIILSIKYMLIIIIIC